MKKIIALILVAIMLLAVLISCKNNNGPSNGDGSSSGSDNSDIVENGDSDDSSSSSDTESYVNDEDTLGEYDFGGKEINIVTRGSTEYEYQSRAGLKGTIVDKAVYTRETSVENRFKVVINIIPMAADWNDQKEFSEKLYAEYLSPSGNWHIISAHATLLYRMVPRGCFLDLDAVENVDMSKVWWSELLYNEMNIDGHMYVAMGDITYTLYEYMQVMFYNQTQLEAICGEDANNELYSLVKEGGWTWEKLEQYAKQFGSGDESLGGDGKYGFILNSHAFRATFASMDTKFDQKDANGLMFYPDTPSERLVNSVELINEITEMPNAMFTGGGDDAQATQNKLFAAGNVLFYPQVLQAARSITSTMEENFGLVPYPKYDEFQDDYKTICKSSVSAVGIMSTVVTSDDQLVVGTVLEALCMEGYKGVIPAYYNTALQKQYLNDVRSTEMLETIRAGLTVGSVASLYVDNALFSYAFEEGVLGAGSVDVASTYAKGVTKARQEIEKFYTTMREMGLAS